MKADTSQMLQARISSWLSLRDRIRTLVLHVASIFTLALVLSVSGAFDSDAFPFWRRLSFHSLTSTLLIVQTSVGFHLIRRILGKKVSVLVSGALTAVVVLTLMTVQLQALKLTPILPYGFDPWLAFALFLAPFVLPVSALVVLAKTAHERFWVVQEYSTDHVDEVLELAFRPVIAGLLPAPSPQTLSDWPQGAIEHIRSVDHYLEVKTASQTVLVRGRMGDALKRLSLKDGIQTHRSWWVAWAMIHSVETRSRDTSFRLNTGALIPIARAREAYVLAEWKARQPTS